MGMPRYAAKKDENHAEIENLLRALGWSVWSLHKVGDGFPDLIIAKHNINILVEIKDGRKEPARQRLSKDQELFHQTWKGRVEVVRSVLDVEALKV